MKILVCGSEGRLMSKTIPHLIEAGHEVVGIDNCQKWGHADKERDYEFVMGDCSDPDVLLPQLAGIKMVIQAAATLYGVMGFHRRAADILSNDLSAQRTALSLSVETGVERVVFISSSMVYEQCDREPHREDDVDESRLPKTDYGLSKVVGERLSRAFSNQYGLNYTIWRPFNVIDPSEKGGTDQGLSHVFADMSYRLINEKQNPLMILGDGHQVRSFVHIDEIARVIADYSMVDETKNETFNVGRHEPVTVRQLAEMMHAKAVKRGLLEPSELSFESLPVPATDVRRRIGTFRKIREELGWESQTTLDTSLDECLDHFKTPSAV